VGAFNAKYLLETDALPMETALLPEFVIVNVRVLVVFGDTCPKLRLALARARVPICWVVPPPDWLTP